MPYLTAHFGNPSAPTCGPHARAAVEAARTSVADLRSCAPGEIVFTAGGCEAVTLVCARRRTGPPRPRHPPDHPSHRAPAVLATLAALRRLHGFRLTVLPVDQHGLVHPDDLAAALTDERCFM